MRSNICSLKGIARKSMGGLNLDMRHQRDDCGLCCMADMAGM